MTAAESTPLVLIVDDAEANRMILADHIDLLGFRAVEATNGLEAMQRLQEEKPDLILLDMMMPIMDGKEVLAKLQEDADLSRIPVVVISGLDDMGTMVNCIERGASDYLLKPINPHMLRARIANSLSKYQLHQRDIALREMTERYNKDLEEHVARQVKEIAEAQLCTIFALSTLAESRDPETGAHLERMREYCRVLASALLRLPQFAVLISPQFVDNIYSASPLHDIGKVGVPDHVLTKPGKLSNDEFEIMKTHCMIGANTLRRVSEQFPNNTFVQMGIEIAESHHERWDGKGYPHGLAGTDIPLPSRVLALCDVYDALTSKRCYKEPFTHDHSMGIILEGAGSQFDPSIVEVFTTVAAEFDTIREKLQEHHEAEAPVSA